MSTLGTECMGQPVETEVLDVIKATDGTLNNLNNYGDNLLHMSAANDCHNIVKEILRTKKISKINQKNDCGWTPLMQAIRNGNIETVKLLLVNGYNLDEDEGNEDISPIGLAAAMGLEMFEIVYSACPAALERAKNNKISPLCAAVLKEDTKLLFRLLELGVDISEASEYTLTLMRQSQSPEIVKLAEDYYLKEDYWTEKWDTMECIDYLEGNFKDPKLSSTLDSIEESEEYERDHLNDTPNMSVIPSIRVIPPSDPKIYGRRNSEPIRVNIPISTDESKRSISPRLTYTRGQIFPASPIPPRCGRKDKKTETEDSSLKDNVSQDNQSNETENFWIEYKDDSEDNYDDPVDSSDSKVLHNSTFNDESKMHKYKIKRPPNLNISKNSEAYLKNTSEASNPAILSSKTPKETRCKTPSPAMVLDEHQNKMAKLFKRFGLTHLLFTFLAEEVDLALFLSLNDQDLQEIGIGQKADRNIILSVIRECNKIQYERLARLFT